MQPSMWIRVSVVLVALALCSAIFISWQADRRDRSQLAVQLVAAQQIIAQATAEPT